jgi:acyl dehydratase
LTSLEDGAHAVLATPWMTSDSAWSDVGRELPVLHIGPFSLADFVRWAGYQENWLRIHYDDAYATGHMQLPGVVQSGNHRTALVLRMITDWLGGRGRVRRLSIRHTAPVRVGDTLTCAGRVHARTPRDGGGLIINLEVWATTGHGQTVSEGVGVVEVTV